MLKHVPFTLKSLIAPLFSSCMVALVVAVFYSSYKETEQKAHDASTALTLNEDVRELSAQIESTQALLGRFSSWMQTGTEIDESLGGVPGLLLSLARTDQMLSAIESEAQEDNAALVSTIRQKFDEYNKVFLRTADVIGSSPYISTNVLISSYPAFDALLQSSVQLEQFFTDRIYTLEEAAVVAKRKALITVFTVSGFAVLASLLAGLLFGRAIAIPIKKLSHVIGCLAGVDYDVTITGTMNRDEIGVMATAVERLKAQLQEKKRLEDESQDAVNNGRIRHALGSANTNMIVADEDGNAIFINHSMKTLLEDVAEHIPRLAHSPGPLDLEHLNLAMLLNNPVTADLLSSSRIDNSELQLGDFFLQQIISPVFDDKSQQIGLVFEWIDMTQQKAKETQIQEANARELAQAEKLRAGANDLLQVVGAALEGDLTRRITVEGSDAIGQIGSALGRFFASLGGNIREISVNADDLKEFSVEFESLNEEMHGLAQEASRQVDQVSIASDEISVNVSSVSAAVTQMDSSIREIARNSEQASVVAGNAVIIAQSADTLMRQLSESSVSIGAMIKVITSIAEQTNLLALNATIEAARAGDAGKGFAVVANEVKDLARETANATDEISRRINAIQLDSDGAVAAISEISEIIVSISSLQGEIATGIQEQKLATQGISQSASETDARTTGIIQSIAKMSASSEHTLAGAVRAHESASKLKSMAGSMHALVAKFTI